MWDDLINSGQSSGQFAVGLDEYLVVDMYGGDLDPFRLGALYLAEVYVAAAIEGISVYKYLESAYVTDIDDVKETVVHLCVRRDHHTAAEVFCVRYAEGDRLQCLVFALVKTN